MQTFPTPSEFVPLPEELQTELVKVLYPGWRAGKVLLEGIPMMMEYENNLAGPTPNPYSPLNSKIDWELASGLDFVDQVQHDSLNYCKLMVYILSTLSETPVTHAL